MRRKTILYIAMSLDGYISDASDGVEWLGGADPKYDGDYGYGKFFQEIDTVVMGWNTYHQVEYELSPGHWPYAGKETYVLTHRKQRDRAGIYFVEMPPEKLVQALGKEEGKHIWICGGADIVRQLLDQNMIDEFRLSIMPCLLGEGTKLFPAGELRRLTLLSAAEENGVLNCVYSVSRVENQRK